MEKLTIKEKDGSVTVIDLTEETMKSNPELKAILERVGASGQNFSQHEQSYGSGGGHDKGHDKDAGYSKEHSRT